jgi:polar amino acid transport system substrate-binding protein
MLYYIFNVIEAFRFISCCLAAGGTRKNRKRVAWTLKMRKYAVIILFLLLAICMLSGYAIAREKTYRVGLLDFPPFAVIEKSGQYSGILVELLEKVLKKANVSYTVIPVPQKRLFQGLAKGDLDIYMGIKGVPAYDGKVLFSDTPVSDIDLRIYALKKAKLIQNRDELRGKKLIVIMGYGYGGLIEYLKHPANNITLDSTVTHELAFRKLKAGRADYVLDYNRPANLALVKEGLENAVHSHSLAHLNIYFIVSKKAPDALKLMKKMEAAYLSLKEEGALREPP